VPTAEPSPGVSVRVIAGEVDGTRSPVETFSDLVIFHVTLQPGAVWVWPKPARWNCLLYTRKGEALMGETSLPVHHTATLYRAAEQEDVTLSAQNGETAEVLLLAGQPLNEPIAIGSNIIMNSDTELSAASRDMRRGHFGPIWDHTDDDSTWMSVVTNHWQKMSDAMLR